MPAARGYALLMALLAIVVVALSTSVALQHAAIQAQRERELQLLFVGAQYRGALERYYLESPGAAKQYPVRLEDLLEDRRWPQPRHHLRQLYSDPFSGKPDWQLIVRQGRIVGVASSSEVAPLKRVGFTPQESAFAAARRHADWRFIADPVAPASSAVPAPDSESAPPPQGRDGGNAVPEATRAARMVRSDHRHPQPGWQ